MPDSAAIDLNPPDPPARPAIKALRQRLLAEIAAAEVQLAGGYIIHRVDIDHGMATAFDVTYGGHHDAAAGAKQEICRAGSKPVATRRVFR